MNDMVGICYENTIPKFSCKEQEAGMLTSIGDPLLRQFFSFVVSNTVSVSRRTQARRAEL